LARERLKLKKIETALDLYNSGDAAYVIQSSHRLSSAVALGTAVRALQKTLSERTPSLLDPAALSTYIGEVKKALDDYEKTAQDKDAEQTLQLRIGIPAALASYKMDPLFTDLENVEDAIRVALGGVVEPEIVYEIAYERGSDTMTNIETATIHLKDAQQCVEIDTEGLKADASTNLTIALDSAGATVRKGVPPDQHSVPIAPETRVITITRTHSLQSASYRLVTDRIWIPFRAFDARWQLPLDSYALLKLRFADDPTIVYPYVIGFTANGNTRLARIKLPPYSYYFASDPVEESPRNDGLIPKESAPSLVNLASVRPIRVELLPWYLSISSIQPIKQYLIGENLIGFLIVTFFTTLFGAVVTYKS
jgi:hypothetical protein